MQGRPVKLRWNIGSSGRRLVYLVTEFPCTQGRKPSGTRKIPKNWMVKLLGQQDKAIFYFIQLQFPLHPGPGNLMNKEPCSKIKVCSLYSWQGVSPPSPRFTIYMYYLIIQLWTVMQDVNLNKGVRDLCLFQLLFCKSLVNWGNLFYESCTILHGRSIGRYLLPTL